MLLSGETEYFSGGSVMNGSLYIGATGLKAHSAGMQVLSNNIANVETLGYRRQHMLFADLMYQNQAGIGGWWGAQENSYVALGQVGRGVQVDSVRTLFTQGSRKMGTGVTDLSIDGKGFFEIVTPDGQKRYTRAGNFKFTREGLLELPGKGALTGFPLDENGGKGAAGPIKVDLAMSSPAKATTSMELTLDVDASASANSADAADPYFGMLKAWNSGATPPLGRGSYAYTQPLSFRGANGESKTVNLYVDGAPAAADGTKTVQFLVGRNAQAPLAGGEMLMAGTLKFDSAGRLMDMSAFTPTGGDANNPANWAPAALREGAAQFVADGQAISLNMGVAASGGWSNAPATAADVGTDASKLPSMGPNVRRSPNAGTGAAAVMRERGYSHDGYAQGGLSNLDVRDDGRVIAYFDNNQSRVIYEIPVCRFTSEDGLRREGGNMFSHAPEAGVMEMGRAGTGSYGWIASESLEISNVDMAREMVAMMNSQRGFQSNSKVITTVDAMLQKAVELKR